MYMAPTSTTTKTTEVLHDEALAALWADQSKKVGLWLSRRDTIMRVTDLRTREESYRNYKRIADPRSFDEAMAAMNTMIDTGEIKISSGFYFRQIGDIQRLIEQHEEARTEMQAATQAIVDHEVNYTGWSRFYLVTSSAGHVHKSMRCSSCKPTTTFGMVPALSGLSETAAVTMLGEALCTVCFPAAPVNPISIPKGVASLAGTPAFAEALAKWQAKVAKSNEAKLALAAEGKRKRPNKSAYHSRAQHLAMYPAADGWV